MLWIFRLYCIAIPCLGDFFSLILVYAIWKKTTHRMKYIQVILYKITIAELLLSHVFGWGWLCDSYYPLTVGKLSGFFAIFGKNGGLICYWSSAIIFLECAASVLESVLARFAFVFKIKFILWFCSGIGYIFNQFIEMAIIIPLLFIGQQFIGNSEEVVLYATKFNMTSLIKTIDPTNDAVFYLHFGANNPILYPIFFGLAVAASFFLLYVTTILTHRKIFSQAAVLSNEQRKLQRSLTAVILVQTTMPILFLGLPAFAMIIYPMLNPIYNNRQIQNWNSDDIGWNLGAAPMVLYASLNSILTLAIMKPYRELFKTVIRQISEFLRLKKSGYVTSLIVSRVDSNKP